MTNKITKREMFTMIKEVAEVKANAEMVAFIDHEIELLDKKSSKSGQTKTQKENEVIIEQVFDALALVGRAVTITELQNEVVAMGELSNQKISAMLRKLVLSGRVVKTVDKKKSYFLAVVDENIEEEGE